MSNITRRHNKNVEKIEFYQEFVNVETVFFWHYFALHDTQFYISIYLFFRRKKRNSLL